MSAVPAAAARPQTGSAAGGDGGADLGRGDTGAPRGVRARERLRALLPPVLAYLASHLLYTVTAALVHEAFLPVDGRKRADTGLYVSIAERGYELFQCDLDPELAPHFAPGAWCGNAGWFPLYPALMRALSPFGLGAYPAGLLITEISLLAGYLLLWHLLRRTATPPRSAWAVLALATLLPAGIYLHAISPVPVAAALLLACVAALHARRWWWAGLAGALVAASYPMGVTVVAIGAGTVLAHTLRRELRPAQALRAGLVSCGLPLLGLAVMPLVHRLTVGRWDAYVLIQEHYGNGVHDPVASLTQLALEPAPIPIADPPPHLIPVLNFFTDAELWWSLALVLLAATAVVVAARRGRLLPVDAGLALLAAAVFVGPLIAGAAVSQYRSHALMLPALLVLRHLPALLTWPYAVAAGIIAAPMGALFSTWLLF